MEASARGHLQCGNIKLLHMYRLKPSLLFPFLCRISSSDLLLEFMYMYKADKDLQQYSFSEFVNLATIPMIPMVTLHKR